MPDLAPLQTQLRTVARQASAACEILERGQAETPLANRFNEVADAAASAPFPIVLLGVTVEARTAALAWLSGHDHNVFAIRVPKEVGLVEVRLQERGYVLEKGDGTRQEFDRLEPFLDAVGRADLVRQGDAASWMEPLQLRCAAPPGVQGLRILMPEGIDAIPANLKRLVGTSNLLAIAAPAEWAPDEAQRRAIGELADSMEAILPIVVGEGAPKWSFGAKLHLPATRAGGELPAIFTQPKDTMREALGLCQVARRFQSAAEMVSERHQDEIRRNSAKQAATSRRLKSLEEAAREDLRTPVEQIRTEFLDEIAKLTEALREANRKAMLANGPMVEELKKLVDTLDRGQLRQEPLFNTIRLSVDEAFQRNVAEKAKEMLHDRLREDLTLLRDGVGALREKTAGKLAAFRGAPVALDLAIPDDGSIWEAIRAMIGVEIHYRGEMPKRGFWQRILEGRQKVMMILMFMTFFGGAFGFKRGAAWVTVLMFALFFWGVIYTFYSWRHEDRDRLEKELERVRDSLQQEARRLLDEASREKMQRLGMAIEELKKEAMRRIDEAGRDTQKSKVEEIEREKNDQRGRLKTAEVRARELQTHGQRVVQLVQACNDFDAAARRALGEVARAR